MAVTPVLERLIFKMKEVVDGLARFAATHPDHAGVVQVVDQGGVLVILGVGNLIDADPLEAANPVSLPHPVDDAVEDVGHSRGGHAQHLRGSALRHRLAVSQQQVFQTIGGAGARLRPGRLFNVAAMSRTADLARTVL